MRICSGDGRWRLRAVAGVAMTTMLFAAGCGGGDSGGSGSSGSDSKPAASLGSKKPATGTPVTLGYVNDGKGQATDQSEGIAAAQATTKYLNAYQGGLAGHPIKLDVCTTKQTPQGADACSNQMLRAKHPIVLYDTGGQVGSVAKKVATGGLVFMTDGGLEPASFTTPGSFNLTNSVSAIFAAPAQLAKEDAIKKAAYIIIDVPATVGPTNTLGKGYFASAGASLDVVRVAPGTPDITPQIQAEIQKGVKQFSILADSTVCSTALKALQQLGFKGRVTVNNPCFTDTPGKGLPNGAEGITVTSAAPGFPPPAGDPNSADWTLYTKVMKTYAPGTTVTGVSPNGYRIVRGIALALQGSKGDITPAAVKSTLASMAPVRLPLGGGVRIQCNGKQSPIGPGLCVNDAVAAELNKDGTVKAYKTVTVDLKLPTPGK